MHLLSLTIKGYMQNILKILAYRNYNFVVETGIYKYIRETILD